MILVAGKPEPCAASGKPERSLVTLSWLWGGQEPLPPENFPEFFLPAEGGGSSGGNGGGNDTKTRDGAVEAYRFDSSALERAAEAANALENSANAKDCLELFRQKKLRNKTDSLIRAKKQLRQQANLDKQKVQYQDQLARSRLNEENLRRQEESIQKQEAMRRATLEHELQKRAELDLKRIEREVLSKGKVERDNQDLTLEQIRLKAKKKTEKLGWSRSSLQGLSRAAGEDGSRWAFCSLDRILRCPRIPYHGLFGSLVARLVKQSLHPIDTYKKIVWRFRGVEDTLKGDISQSNQRLQESLRHLSERSPARSSWYGKNHVCQEACPSWVSNLARPYKSSLNGRVHNVEVYLSSLTRLRVSTQYVTSRPPFVGYLPVFTHKVKQD
ncbi:hypothetical protein HAZT_HAZT007311 [Hyalella azteca]|uniref:ATPase family AAA domain-containing protein n=1 Tax=Hyalella azteca TaxID=294128 RepID=A0A6A0HGS5_HYAAZ|nr:hypothetical protein HAZT_HAZT007311 [Hyalella azteca]